MKLRIFPRDESFFDLFEAAADNMAESARLLDDLLEDFVDPELKAKRLVEHEHEGDRITHAILTRLNSTFITPFDREDIYALAAQLDDVVDAVEEAADMLVLHKVEEPIQPVREQVRIIRRAAEETAQGLRHLRKLNLERLRAYQVAVTELEEEGDRVYRRARADLYNFDAEHPARYVLVWRTSSSSWRRRWTAWTRLPTPSRASCSSMADARLAASPPKHRLAVTSWRIL
jgi:predicted phosphate transport protein (TIGR00153 family)